MKVGKLSFVSLAILGGAYYLGQTGLLKPYIDKVKAMFNGIIK